MTARALALLFVSCFSGRLNAGSPRVTQLFPCGVRRGETAGVQVLGTLETWPPGIDVEGGGIEVRALAEKSKLTVKADPDALPGVRWIRLFDAQGSATPRPFVVGTIVEMAEIEPNDTPVQATPVTAAEVTANGRLARRGDVDCFAVRLERGQTLVASIDAFRRLGSPMDAVLQAVSEEGFVLAQSDDDAGFDPLLTFTAPNDGHFVVRAFAFPAQPDSTIGFAGGDAYVYRLTLTTGLFADYAFPLAAQLGTETECAPAGWNVAPGVAATRIGPFREAGRHDVQLGGSPNLTSLRIVPFTALVETGPTSRSQPQDLPFPAAVSGRIDPAGDADVFRLQAPGGQALRIAIESRAMGRPLDPVVRLFDKAGKKLLEADDSGESRDVTVASSMPQDGECLVEVTDLHGRGGWRFAYVLTASPPEPAEFQLTLGADAFTLAPEKSVELPVSLERRNGFGREIDLSVVDLPGGVEAAASKSSPQGDTAKSVKLTLKAAKDAQAWSGPIRVVGRAAGDPAMDRTASVSLPGMNASTQRIWLTLLKS